MLELLKDQASSLGMMFLHFEVDLQAMLKSQNDLGVPLKEIEGGSRVVDLR